MRNVTDRVSNPFDIRPPCERFVPGYGDANAHFHVVGDHPGRHGGAETGVPFTNRVGKRLQRALRAGGLLRSTGDRPVVDRTFCSYRHMCVPDGEPTADDYAALEPLFDAELRAIAAHVLLPVGDRATRHVLATYTATSPTVADEDCHATELGTGAFLVIPVRDPAEWEAGDEAALVEALVECRRTDYRREADLGRFLPGDDPYLVR